MTVPVGSDAHISLNSNRTKIVLGVVSTESETQYYFEPFLAGNGYWFATVYNTDSSNASNKVTSGTVKIKVVYIDI